MPFSPQGRLSPTRDAVITVMPNPKLLPGQTWKRWTGPVFEAEPRAGDVKQGNIGDCFLMAAINAILLRPDGPAAIQEMVQDKVDHVIVRMFKNGVLHLVKVEKTLPYDGFGSMVRKTAQHNLGAKWVTLFEKAYAGFIVDGGYPRLAEGSTGLGAMAAFLGPGMEVAAEVESDLAMLTRLILLSNRNSTVDGGINGKKTVPNVIGLSRVAERKRSVGMTFGISDRQVEEWADWNCDGIYTELKQTLKPPYELRFDQVVARLGAALTCRDAILAWYRQKNPIPGAVGTGNYTPTQMNFFRRLQRSLATNHPVTLQSKNTMLGRASGRGHSAGEAMIAGLVARHVYSAIDTKTEGIRNFVLLRNPWGHTHRGYTPASNGTLVPKAVQKGIEGWLELTDLFLNFNTQFGEGVEVQGPARMAFRNGLEAQLQAQALKLDPVTRARAGATLLAIGRPRR